MIIDVVIPALNEEQSIGKVVSAIDTSLVRNVIVVDNGSKDQTSQVAEEAGAIVLKESERGYGAACLKGIAYVNLQTPRADIVAFMDADFSDYPEQLREVVDPIISGEADLVIGSRALGKREFGSLTPQQVFGNWLATRLIRLFYKVKFTDLGPFRAIRLSSLNAIGMKDRNYGWTVEMQVKGAKHRLKMTEVSVDYKKRIGKSKVAGTLKGTILAGYKIITTIFKNL